VKKEFNDTYVIRVNEEQRICWTPVDENNTTVTTNLKSCPSLSELERDRLLDLFETTGTVILDKNCVIVTPTADYLGSPACFAL